eukprot:COSAG02_NODE_17336_length_1011_cov_1.413377_1_plen_64_part_10
MQALAQVPRAHPGWRSSVTVVHGKVMLPLSASQIYLAVPSPPSRAVLKIDAARRIRAAPRHRHS